MKLVEKIRINAGKTREREIRFLNIPIVQYGKKEENRIKEKYIDILPKSYVKKCLKIIYDKLPHKYDLIYILRCNAIGENYLLTYLFEEVQKKKHAQNVCFIMHKNNAHYIETLKLFTDIDIFVTEVPLSVLNAVLTKFTYMYHNTEFHIHHCPLNKTADFLHFKQKEHYTKTIMRYVGATKYRKKNIAIDTTKYQQIIPKVKNLNLQKFIFLAPECKSLIPLENNFWEELSYILKKKGYDIYINTRSGEFDSNIGHTANLTCAEAVYLANLSQGIISMRSGLTEVLATLNKPMHIIYSNSIFDNSNDLTVKELFTLKDYPNSNPQKIFEYSISNNCPENIIKSIVERF